MGNSLQQYRAALGSHFIYLKSRDYNRCFKGKFWCSMVLLYYMEAYYLPVLKTVVDRYKTMMINRFWLTQIYFYNFYIPDLIRLANDVETNPGPNDFRVSVKRTLDQIQRDGKESNCNFSIKKVKTLDNLNTSKMVMANSTTNGISAPLKLNLKEKLVCRSDGNMTKILTKSGIDVCQPFLFIPCDSTHQTYLCSLLDLPLAVARKSKSELPKPLGKPTKLCKIQGDGNCLFRSLSYLVTGRQVYHKIIRSKIVEHMRNIENSLHPHINSSLEEYLVRTGMNSQSVWGTDIEILTACSLLETDIYVYSWVGSIYKWQKFSRSMLCEDIQYLVEPFIYKTHPECTMMLC